MKWKVLTGILAISLVLGSRGNAQNLDPHNLQRWNILGINKLTTKFANSNLLCAGTDQLLVFPAKPPAMEYPSGSGINFGGDIALTVGGRRQADAGGHNPKDWPYVDSGVEEGPAWFWDPHHFETYPEFVASDSARALVSNDPASWPTNGPNHGWPAFYPGTNDSLLVQPVYNAQTGELMGYWPGAGAHGELIGDQEAFSVDHTVDYVDEKLPGKAERWLNIQTTMRGIAWNIQQFEDMIFWEFTVRNLGAAIDSAIIGMHVNLEYFADFEPYGGSATGGEDGEDKMYYDPSRQLIYGTDGNGQELDPQGNLVPSYKIPWGGVVAIKTPRNLGLTRVDIFDGLRGFSTMQENGIYEELFYYANMLNLNDPDDADGNHIDDDRAFDNNGDGVPDADYKYGYPYSFMGTGPFEMQPGEIDTLIIATVFGVSKQDLLKNVDAAIWLVKHNWQVPKPPPEPKVKAVAGDRKVTLIWGRDSESDPNFEGYRIYRSSDGGKTWGEKYISDVNGTPIGWVPIAEYDLVDGISGVNPNFPYFNMGSESGLGEITRVVNGDTMRVWTDNTVVNGLPYLYYVSSYDKGQSVFGPLENSPRTNPDLPGDNTVRVIPSTAPVVSKLDSIRVVPNPFVIAAGWEIQPNEERIDFSGLPSPSSIRIYNASGELVRELHHNNPVLDRESWDLKNYDGQQVAPGLYYYHIETKVGEKIGKLAIVH